MSFFTLQWRHNGRNDFSNHQPHDYLFNRLFRCRKKASKLRVTVLCGGIHRWPVNFPHKGPVTRKMFPFDDVIMGRRDLTTSRASVKINHAAILLSLVCILWKYWHNSLAKDENDWFYDYRRFVCQTKKKNVRRNFRVIGIFSWNIQRSHNTICLSFE